MNELSNPEYAALVETQHLKECEDHDYLIMERLLTTRCSIDDEDFSPDEPNEQSQRRMLRRETAIELPVTPSKSLSASLAGDGDKPTEYSIKNERPGVAGRDKRISPVSSQNSPRNSQYQTYLNPVDGQRLFKKSSESLQKNSSTETDYSHPYKVIRQQGSTETNTSINSSFNVDNASFTNDLSLDFDHSVNQTVIENPTVFAVVRDDERLGGLTKRAASLGSSDMRPPKESKMSFLKKQFSIDQGTHRREVIARPHSEHIEAPASEMAAQPQESSQVQNFNPSLLSAKLHILQESSSTSTEDAKDEINIPRINTNVVQDEIAKLSSTIKSGTKEDRDPPFNETMC